MFENMENYIFKMSFQISVLLLLYTRVILTIGRLEGPNVCHGDNGKEQCCYNYEEEDGKCQICRNGTSSKQGQKCLPCLENMYGYKCLERCSCSKFQRHFKCEKEQGTCVVDLLSTEKFSTERYLDTYQTMRDESTTKMFEMDDQFKRVLHHELFIYSVCVTLIIAVIGISFVVLKCKRKYSKRVLIPHRESMQHVNVSTNQHYIYDEIDESGIIDIEAGNKNRNGRSNMPDYFDFGHADPSISSKESNEDYLYPCLSSNDTSQNDNHSDTESVTICVDALGYLSSYQRLQDNWNKCSHKYELSVNSNALECNVTVIIEGNEANTYVNACSSSDNVINEAFWPAPEEDIHNEMCHSTNNLSEINQSVTKTISSAKQEFGLKISELVPKCDTDTEVNDYKDNASNDYLDAI